MWAVVNPVLLMERKVELNGKMTRLVKPSPPPSLCCWPSGSLLLMLLQTHVLLIALTTKVSEWWSQEKARMAIDVCALLPTSSHAQGFFRACLLAPWRWQSVCKCLPVSVLSCLLLQETIVCNLTGGLLLCLGSCLRQRCCTASKFDLWESPGEA